MRIASLLPSATEIAVALGSGDALVGRSHECDFPLWVAGLPACTSTKLEKGLASRQIDARAKEIVRQGLSMYEVDAGLLRSLRPDVILTQTQCAVCAVTPADLEEALGDWLGEQPVLISLAPDTLDDVFGDFARVGEATGALRAAEEVVAGLRDRLAAIGSVARRPTVAAIEWADPLMAAGNWIPELIEAAGGQPLFASAGEHSFYLDWQALLDADPDVVILMPCGYRVAQALADLPVLRAQAGWSQLSAVRNRRVFAADGHHFFNRPGPRVIESAEIVAAILSAADTVMSGESWSRVSDG